jgi:SAM-dependent methyltransferase
MDPTEHRRLFDQYFSLFSFVQLPRGAEAFDLGCCTGRWAALVAPQVGLLHCIDPAEKALSVARRRLSALPNVSFHQAGVDDIPLADESQDFGYAMGVLHHIPDTARAMRDAARKLKPGTPFLVYLYYSFDNRPAWFHALWGTSDIAREAISRLPFPLRKTMTWGIAALVYWPLSRSATLLERAGMNVSRFPLSAYGYRKFYSLKTDALDRFGTRLEQRFSKDEIHKMMEQADLTDIAFRDDEPFWVARGRRQDGPRK